MSGDTKEARWTRKHSLKPPDEVEKTQKVHDNVGRETSRKRRALALYIDADEIGYSRATTSLGK